MFKQSHLFLTLLLSFTLISTASCKQGASSEYSVLESGYNAFKKTHWIDNDRVIFSGYPGGLPKNNDQRGIYIWNTKTGKVEFLAKAEGGLCFDSDNNYVHYALGRELLEQTDTDVTERIGWGYGQFGAEQEEWNTVVTPRSVDQKEDRLKSLFNKFTCKIVERPPELKDHSWDPLLPSHGYLDYGPRLFPDEHSKTRFLRSSDKRLITLPIKRREALGIKYIAFKDAYFIYNIFGSREDWKKTRCKTFWWLYPDGRVEDICVPYSPMEMKPAHLPFFIQPTAKGMLLQGGGFKDDQGKVIEGSFFILNKDGPHVIDRGLIGAYSVSPNGCKVAYSQAGSLDEAKRLGGHQLKMVNICTNNGTGEQ